MLSTGQRCSLVLPLLLSEQQRTLILDQPEDHLDNAYLVDNTVMKLRSRSRHAQTIVVTHNANIPVLGNADQVVALQSDGRRGYVFEVGPLNSPRIVDAITSLMEGGSEAFSLRASFYQMGRIW
jgi:ABC-type bacteriocin/lantibiotic exporter with double-glycine peptidase domain